jgi:hypothetical protein
VNEIPDPGTFLFQGGPNGPVSDLMTQTIDLSMFSDVIDGNDLQLSLSALMAGQASLDEVFLAVTFFNANNNVLFELPEITDPMSTGDLDIDSFDQVAAAGEVPTGTREAEVKLRFSRSIGFSSDSYADNVKFCVSPV